MYETYYRIANQLKDPRSCEIMKFGWMKKRTTQVFFRWVARYCVLYSNCKLVYYQPKNSSVNMETTQ